MLLGGGVHRSCQRRALARPHDPTAGERFRRARLRDVSFRRASAESAIRYTTRSAKCPVMKRRGRSCDVPGVCLDTDAGSAAERTGAAAFWRAVGARLVFPRCPGSSHAPPADRDAHPELCHCPRLRRLVHAGIAGTARSADALRARAQARARDALPGSIAGIRLADGRVADGRAAAPAEQRDRNRREHEAARTFD